MPVTNSSNQVIHLNKHTKIGTLCEKFFVKELENSTTELLENINLIQASNEVIAQRQKDLVDSDFDLRHLEPSQSDTLLNLLLSNFHVFSKSLATLGHTDHIVPKLTFNHDYPIKALPFPIPYSLQDEAKRQLAEMQDAGIIEKTVSEWACPMLLVKKKPDSSGKQSYRIALDLRMINSILQSSAYPLPRIQDILNNLSKYQYFCTLDFCSAYHQIALPQEYSDRLAFNTPWGTYKYSRLVFGLKNAASCFQALIDKIMDEANIEGLYAFQDDVVIGSNSFNNGKLQKHFCE